MNISLCAIAKNEDNYLKEWVDYNLNLGWDDIYIFQNNWRYTRNDINDPRVHFIILDGKRMQNPCYNGFYQTFKNNYDFMAFFDIDEFLYLKNKRDIKDWLSEFQDERVIYVFWRLFGDNGLKEVKDNNYSVLDRFKKCDDKLFPLGKPIINTKKNNRELLFFNPHIVIQTLPQDVKEENLINLSLPNKKKCKRPWLLTEEEMKKYSDQPIELWHFRNKTYQENYERKFKQDDAYHDSEKCDFHQDLDVFNKEFEKYNRNIIDVSEI